MESLFRDQARRDEERVHRIVREYLARIDPAMPGGRINLSNPRNVGVLPPQLGGTGGNNWSNPLTTLGDLITAGPSGVPRRLALGPSGTVITATPTGPQYRPVVLAPNGVTAGSYTNLNATVDATGRLTAAADGAAGGAGVAERFGVVFGNDGTIALRGDGTIASKRY